MADDNKIFELLDALSKGAPESVAKATQWFKKTASNLKPSEEKKKLGQQKIGKPLPTSKGFVGRMYTFAYNPLPESKAKLPYYDRLPLIFLIEPAKGGFLGINLHYLSPKYRQVLLNRMFESYLSDKDMDDETRLKINYKILKGVSKLKWGIPCIRRYKNSGVRSNIALIPSKEWNTAIYLPTKGIIGAGTSKVWSDSINKVK